MEITLKKLKLNKKDIEFAQPNVECECGCGGGHMSLVIEDEKDIYGVMCTILDIFDCEHCFGVAFKKDGQAFIANKLNQVVGETDQLNAIRNLHKIVDELNIHHMVILNEIEDGKFAFVH